MVGHRPGSLCRGEPGQPGRPEHDRAGGLRRGGLFRPEHAKLPRHRGRDARPRRRRGRRTTARPSTDFVRRCLEDPDYADRLGDRARALVASQLGATERTVSLLVALAGRGRRDRAAAYG